MPSKHLYANQLIRRGLYDGLSSFGQLEQRISALGDENTKIVGDAFEIFVEAYLATQQKLQAESNWLVGQVPLDIRQQLNLPNDSKGIDGIFRTRTGTLVPYQVKFRSRRAYLTYTEVAPFLGLTERASDRIIFTNSNEVAEDAKNRDGMRTVRGIDFDDLTEDEFSAINRWLNDQPSEISKLIPRPYQIKALAKIRETLTKSDRAQVVMACGTGKTLVALWATEALEPKTILVLVPSLTLLQQTLDQWSRHNHWGTAFTYLCVCSDPTVVSKDANDPIRLDAMDLEFPVVTNPVEVRRFLGTDRAPIKVVFSTYQSSRVVSEGVLGLAPFDVAIFDEAHKTTGRQARLFAQGLKDENIPVRKRLFFTATPRHYDIRHRDQEGDFRIVSMGDELIYGPCAYTLTFGSAAQQGIICNYKVVISVVDGQEVNEFALQHGITLVEGDLIGARWVANQIAVERAVEETHAERVITFHSRVSSAKEFSTDGSRGVGQFLHDFSVFHVNGDQKSSERKQRIHAFREARKGLITNARCLTEGIDVPAVDMVAFIDPRHSKIDIAQATGRAIRKPEGSEKTTGYVVVPVFLERDRDETLDAALERSDFRDLADVLNAMQEQDDALIDIIRELKEAKGRGEVFNPLRLIDKVEVIGPSISLTALRSAIFAHIVETNGVAWDEWYGRLVVYKEREGHCLVPALHTESNYRLGSWVNHQRTHAGSIPPDRRRRLDQLGFVWDVLAANWETGFNALVTFKHREGHCNVPVHHVEGDYRLGAWVIKQRSKAEKLLPERRKRLDEFGFVWDPFGENWEDGLAALVKFNEREGHCRVPQTHIESDFSLGMWASNQRADAKKMPPDRRQRLDELDFVWDARAAHWEDRFAALVKFKEREGHCRVPQRHLEGDVKLGLWVSAQRAYSGRMSAARKLRLNEIGFLWDPFTASWEKGFAALVKFKAREGHCRVPGHYVEDNYKLGTWVSNQRPDADKIPPVRRMRLDELGFIWHALDVEWENIFNTLVKFKQREGHCRVPVDHIEDDYRLGRWVSKQRERAKKNLPPERKKRLDELGFDWDAPMSKWEDAFGTLLKFREREGHCRVPKEHIEGDHRLGRWVSFQRRRFDQLSAAQKKRLDEVGFFWDPLTAGWERGFAALVKFKAREGHCRVPFLHTEGDYRLGQWVNNQRNRASKMPPDRRKRLDELGFVWDARGANSENVVTASGPPDVTHRPDTPAISSAEPSHSIGRTAC